MVYSRFLTKNIVERALASELDNHLGYSKYVRNHSDNSRNSSYNKRLTTDQGGIDLDVPRDRSGIFEPMIVPKH
ncbi:Mutator family [Cardinium endosymbiont of Sogatella furcifera]|uniref:transposase n=1 Tax=Cardinium endosymbiont of Sogatella furcifera TaxID=650378 RepID=UPI000E10164E|nr:transposase [Cardinium endosymbiont of Sogatella furcifera]AXI24007.1 Mutator family [Cardinium endosymbiont of Sogatella furcifera]